MGSDEIMHYIVEQKKRADATIFQAYVVVNVSRPMNVTNHLFVEQLLHRDDQPYVVNQQDVR